MTIRFSPFAHDEIARAANIEGVTFAQYVREASLLRACIQHGLELRGDRDMGLALRDGLAFMRERAPKVYPEER